MPRPPLFEWHGKEYASEEKGADWYWALGIVAAALIVVCVLFNNILLALVIAAATIALALQSARRPRVHTFAITEGGIIIDRDLYPYESMLHFSVFEYIDETIPPSLSIKTKHLLAPHLLIPIIGYDPVDIYDYIAFHLPEGKHDESIVDRVIELLHL
jgi:hypothetical protein